MDLLNVRVKHNIFGVGTIIDCDSHYLTIQFGDKARKFVYPDAFAKFLKAENQNMQEAIITSIISNKQAEDERRQANLAAHKIKEEREKHTISSAITKSKDVKDGFGPDYNVQHLARTPIFTYQEVEQQFNIKITGFGRGINKTPCSVILISSVEKKKSGFIYHDHWTAEGDYIYSGEGKSGDQTMSSGNKAIVDADTEGRDIHLFVKFSPQEYYYQGVFKLVDYTYENDKDENGNTRKEYKFRLRKV
jgi:hypothetical protein